MTRTDEHEHEEEEEVSPGLPLDFDADVYRELNKDLMSLSSDEAARHYRQHGRREGRYCSLGFLAELPPDFDYAQYVVMNPDLGHLAREERQAQMHYYLHGRREKRAWKDPHFDAGFFVQRHDLFHLDRRTLYFEYVKDIRLSKNRHFELLIESLPPLQPNQECLFLVNHDCSLTGATHYLYMLFHFLAKQLPAHVSLFLCETKYKTHVWSKYKIPRERVIEYKDDPTLLYMYYDFYRPKMVYLNSCNHSIYHAAQWIPRHARLAHSHEIRDHYLLANELAPDFVVSARIAQQYHYSHSTIEDGPSPPPPPQVLPPFFSNLKAIIKRAQLPLPVKYIANACGKILDPQHITVATCGQITDRKNYQLFIAMAAAFPQHNFVWIGDDDQHADVFAPCPNIFHIATTINPYMYFAQLVDYFILFSKQDPCPYVVLENILLETPTITFEKNIYYDHKHKLTAQFYHEIPGAIDEQLCRHAIQTLVIQKKPAFLAKKGNGYKYIKRFFQSPAATLIDRVALLFPHHTTAATIADSTVTENHLFA